MVVTLTEDEKNFIMECVYMASREGFYSFSWDNKYKALNIEEAGRSALEKLGFDKPTVDDCVRGY